MHTVAGHDVITVNEVGLSGQPDSVVLNYARQNNRMLLTRNCRDFEAIHQENPCHSGILAIYENRDYSKDQAIPGGSWRPSGVSDLLVNEARQCLCYSTTLAHEVRRD